jgi:hypothetical protein
MDNKENLWDKFNQLDEVATEASASIEILNPENKKQKGLVTEEEFNKIFADFL